MSRDLQITIDDESADILDSVDDIHHNTLVSHALKVFSGTAIFQKLYLQKTDSSNPLDNRNLQIDDSTDPMGTTQLDTDIDLNDPISETKTSETVINEQSQQSTTPSSETPKREFHWQ